MDDITLIIVFTCSGCLNVYRDVIDLGRTPKFVQIEDGWVQLIQTCSSCGYTTTTVPFIFKVKEYGEIVSYPQEENSNH